MDRTNRRFRRGVPRRKQLALWFCCSSIASFVFWMPQLGLMPGTKLLPWRSASCQGGHAAPLYRSLVPSTIYQATLHLALRPSVVLYIAVHRNRLCLSTRRGVAGAWEGLLGAGAALPRAIHRPLSLPRHQASGKEALMRVLPVTCTAQIPLLTRV